MLFHYKLDRILGQGGTGRVYRGIDTKKGGVVALKLFNENFFRNALHLRDLRKSIKRSMKFDHEHVIKTLGFLEKDEEHCMVMEYVDGINLKQYITRSQFKLQERLRICREICSGLQYLHDQDCIHHDFKPSNVLFTRRGKVKLADFSLYGSSILFGLIDSGYGEQITPLFVAPEIIRKEKANPASDQYSLGITMYMMFTERVPFAVDSLQQLYQCHLRITPNTPAEINPNCPADLSEIIMRLLRKDPEKRFKDCFELQVALSKVGQSRI